MRRNEMEELWERHKDAEARRDFDAVLDTFAEDCFLETVPLGLRAEGKEAVRMAYEGLFTAIPDHAPNVEGIAYGDDVLVMWGQLTGTNKGALFGVPPSGGSFRVPFTNTVTFADGRMAGESILFDLATFCEQANVDLDAILKARTAMLQAQGAASAR